MAIPKTKRTEVPFARERAEAADRIARTSAMVAQLDALHEERNELILVQSNQTRRHGKRDFRVARSEQPHMALVIELNKAIDRVSLRIHAWWHEFLVETATFSTFDLEKVVDQVILERGVSAKALARAKKPNMANVDVDNTNEYRNAKRLRATLHAFYSSWLAALPEGDVEARDCVRRKIAALTSPVA